MLISYRLRRRLRYHRRIILSVLATLFLLDCASLLLSRPRDVRTPAGRPGPRRDDGAFPVANTTVFIASVHRNTEKIMRGGWNDAVLALVDHLGAANVHFSAVESGSQEQTKEMLLELKAGLDARGASNTVILGSTVWEQLDELWARPPPDADRRSGWIWNQAEGIYDMRRIPYLARARNQAMEPLRALEREQGRTFDWVFWVNDVIFEPEDFTTLLDTRDGGFDAACSMDFKSHPYYYDTFALRDDRGDKTASLLWPWFLSPTSRAATLRGEPVPVASCWNGVVLFRSAPFYADKMDMGEYEIGSQEGGGRRIDRSRLPLRFRGVDDSLADFHLEGSECCLIHADIASYYDYRDTDSSETDTDEPYDDKEARGRSQAAARDGGGGGFGTWLNPNVRVGYSPEAYAAVRAVAGARFPGPLATIAGAWANRLGRWKVALQARLERREVAARLGRWRRLQKEEASDDDETGEACLINEMQIMWMNGWKHL